MTGLFRGSPQVQVVDLLMASLDLKGAMGTIGSREFVAAAFAVVLGSLTAQIGTAFIRENVYDLQVFPGDDAIYAFALAFLLVLAGQMVGQEKHMNNAALGAGAAGVRVVASQNDVI